MADMDRDGCECDDCGECSCCNWPKCRVCDLYLYNCCYCCGTCNCRYLCCYVKCQRGQLNNCCGDEENEAARGWLCFVSDCCNPCRRQESPNVNTPSVLTPPSVYEETAQPHLYEKAWESAVTSQPMKS